MRPLSSAALPVWLAVLPLVALLAGWWTAPEATARWAAKEGPVEHVSHAVLAVALIGWGAKAVRMRGVAIAVALWCALVLAEELDWGKVYGVHGIADLWIGVVGRPDLHNAWGGASYVLFGIPILGLLALGWRERSGLTRVDALALALIVGASLLGTLIGSQISEAIEPVLDEVSELSLYAVLAVIGWRATPTARTPPDTDDPRPCSARRSAPPTSWPD